MERTPSSKTSGTAFVLLFRFIGFRHSHDSRRESVPGVGLDAHAVPEETLAATAASLVCRFAVKANIRVFHPALQIA